MVETIWFDAILFFVSQSAKIPNLIHFDYFDFFPPQIGRRTRYSSYNRISFPFLDRLVFVAGLLVISHQVNSIPTEIDIFWNLKS